MIYSIVTAGSDAIGDELASGKYFEYAPLIVRLLGLVLLVLLLMMLKLM